MSLQNTQNFTKNKAIKQKQKIKAKQKQKKFYYKF
jgi:hypothetical protein